MVNFTFIEYADMHLCYGEARQNSHEARRIYQERYPLRRVPSHPTFQEVDRRIRETGSFKPAKSETGRPRAVRTQDMEEDVLHTFEHNPRTSTRRVSAALGVNHVSIWQVLKEQSLHPYHLQQVQHLLDRDWGPRVHYCRWLLRKIDLTPNFVENVLFTDEACFTRDGVLNFHNMHEWCDENPHRVLIRNHQFGFSINVWAGIVGDCFIGPFRLANRLTGELYLNFLRDNLNQLLEDVPLNIRRKMYFMQDGAPAHFEHNVRNYLNLRFGNKWIGRGGPIAWPPRSPDLTPMDFYVWGYLKDIVYATEIDTEDELWRRILEACEQLKNQAVFLQVRGSIQRRAQLCLQEQGHQFEHL